jgi:2-polyprenyl-6-methoxyphenol hydroxylase-like FAD-dependent oxidoreductase
LGPSQVFAVFEVASPASEWKEVRVALDQEATSVVWSLGGQRFRFSFEMLEDQVELGRRAKRRLSFQVGSDVYPHLGRELLDELSAERTPWLDAPITEIDWQVAVRFERRLAGSFGRAGVWLVGDAAHLAGPVGVHSMNIGMREAHGLAERLAANLRGTASPGLLERYEVERRAEWKQLLAGADALVPGPRASDWVQARAGRILSSIPASGEDLRLLLGQLGLELPRLATAAVSSR